MFIGKHLFLLICIQKMMKKRRWLLPFTYGMNPRAIAMVVQQAEASGAMLVAVSLVATPHSETRLKQIQQANNFLKSVQNEAVRQQVDSECHAVFTKDVKNCFKMLIYDLHCDSIVVVSSGKQGILMHTDEMASLLIQAPASLVLLRLSEQEECMTSSVPCSTGWFRSWLCFGRKQKEDIYSIPPITVEEKVSRITSKENALSNSSRHE